MGEGLYNRRETFPHTKPVTNFSPRFSYTVTITIKDVSISATASKKKDAKNLAFKNMAIRLEDKVSFWFRSRKNN